MVGFPTLPRFLNLLMLGQAFQSSVFCLSRRRSKGSLPFRPALVGLLVLLASGCQLMPTSIKTNDRVQSNKDIAVNSEQIRLRMRALVQPMSGVIVSAADQISAGTTEESVKREALLWKIEAVPALREALFQPSPMTAVFDAWVLTFQMTDYFEHGSGGKALGTSQSIAVEACRYLESEMARVAASLTVSGDVSKGRAFGRKWAAAHPIRGSIASRESTLSRVAERDVAGSFSATEAIANMTTTVDDLNRKLEIYTSQVPEQARWQAELFTDNLASQYGLDRAMPLAESAVGSAQDALAHVGPAVDTLNRAVDSVDRLVPAVEKSLAIVEQAPALIASEREAALKTLSAEITRTITFVQEERIAALKQLTSERIAAVQELRDTVVQERKILTADITTLSANVVDQAFIRAVQLCAGVLIALFIGAVLLLIIASRLFSPASVVSKPFTPSQAPEPAA